MLKSITKFGDFFEVIIIGGGPAGCAVALKLHQLNPELAKHSIILEKSCHPREKVCGGALTLHAETILAQLGVNLDVSHAFIRNSRFVYGQANINLPEDGVAKKVIRRDEFDNFLIKQVKNRDFKVAEQTKVIDITTHRDFVAVRTNRGDLKAKVVVSADGVSAILRKTPGFNPKGRISRLWLIETPVDPTKHPVFQDQVLHVDFSYVRCGIKGYYWEFPSYINNAPHINQGLVDSNLKCGTRINGKNLLCQILRERNVLFQPENIKCHPLRQFDPKDIFAQPRRLLTGDAIGTDPLFSEGISQALALGCIAAESITQAFSKNDFTFADYKQKILSSRVGQELKTYNFLSKYIWGFMFEPFLCSLYNDQSLRNLMGYSYGGQTNILKNKTVIAKALIKHLLLLWPRLKKFRQQTSITTFLLNMPKA
ncbi:MAG: NAD(P)/FAD-dependent oxidoreductase [Gammaproteobacteria bacterium]|nr:NAD(P)/FAD-dependent oxidoreductase [Gammaproteobacteria bacterium]